MSDWVIRARDLSKIYRLYAKPHHRILDLLGLMRPERYKEHTALDRVSIEIRRGEKIAVIGRNGAGKSTFLKLVTQVIRPTSGELEVQGKVQALLQIGTGFHPEFTGRQNVYAYLAQLGVTGREAEAKIAEIVDFAELEEYIDQPTKTYSTGMGARLMFATSTAVTPDVLVLDEILGVGDAYFAQKSFDRMRALCEGEGTTLLLVTHDVYSALRIASRILWIDRGRLLMDGDGASVVNAYEDSIRVQEEQRLRLRKQESLKAAVAEGIGRTSLLVEIHAKDARPQPSPVFFSRIALVDAEKPVAELPLGEQAFDAIRGSHLQREATSWGESADWQGRRCRAMLNYGSPFHKVAGWLDVPPGLLQSDTGAPELVIEYWSEKACDLSVKLLFGHKYFDLGAFQTHAGGWQRHTRLLSQASGASTVFTPELNAKGVLGTGVILLRNVAMLDADGHETHFARHGERATFLIDYEIVDPQIREKAQVIIALHGESVHTSARFSTATLSFDAAAPRGRIQMSLPRMMMGRGSYLVSVMIAEEGYFDREHTVFFSINPGVYFVLSRVMEIQVTGGGTIASGTVFVGDGEWSLVASGDAARAPRAENASCAE